MSTDRLPPDSEPVTARNVALTNCDRELIQFSGAIQPHALLMVLDARARTLVGISANAPSWLACDKLPIGEPVTAVLATKDIMRLRAAIDDGRAIAPKPLGVVHDASGRALGEAQVHHSDAHVLLEFDASAVDDQASQTTIWLTEALSSPPGPPEDAELPGLLETAVERIRTISGFERVMAYRFLPDWSGEVIAESLAAGQTSFLRQHFPASDIPEPARRLFASGWVRTLPDVDYAPVPIVMQAGESTIGLDLSRVAARSVSVMYTDYLRNMGVRATMVLTLYCPGRLWGMISCHHVSAPRRVTAARKRVFASIAQSLSHQIAAISAAEQARHAARMRERLANVIAALGSADDFGPVLMRHADALIDGFGATGMAVCIGSRVERRGLTPEEPVLRELAQWLTGGRPAVFATERLGALFAPMAGHTAIASGVLAIRVSRVSADFVMWFRGEQAQVIHWAGMPEKPQRIESPHGGPRLTPRKSFELWEESVRGESLPWRPEEREAANELRRAALDILVERSVLASRRAMLISRDNEALVSADQRKDAFIAMLGHELRTPLAALEYGIAAARHARLEGQVAIDALDLMARQTAQMTALVDDIVDIARIAHNRLELRRRRVRVAELVRAALEANASALERAAQAVTIEADESLHVLADPVRLNQILSNLIVNALRHGASTRPIELRVRAVRDHALIEVRDHGPGIAPAQQRTIFEAFSAPLGTADAARAGLGLGLALVRRLVEAHQGTISVESRLGDGACFTVRLPRAEPPESSAAVPPVGGGGMPAGAKSRRVLIVDDDADAAVSLAMLMRVYGHEARKAHDGAAAMAVLARYAADVVTIDLNLPDIDGASLARAIRAKGPTGVVVICISGDIPGSALDHAAFDHVMTKPARPENLFAIIDAID